MDEENGSRFIDYYDLLGVRPTAEITAIRRAYLLMAKQHHPDAGGSTEQMQQLNTAYRTLTSASSKAGYDMLHSFHTGTTSLGDYKYHDGREVNSVSDMSDDEVDAFLDNLLFNEYRDGVPKKRAQSTSRSNLRKWWDKIL